MQTHALIAQYAHSLRALDAWLERATTHATERKFDVDVLAQARLAPDQYPLAKQVQSACDAAKFAAAYLSNQKAPAHPDTETTIVELRARIASCIAYLESVPESAFAGAAERRVAPPWLRGKWLPGAEYALRFATPNFYFHVTTAYAILRHNGVALGKMDFIGPVALRDE